MRFPGSIREKIGITVLALLLPLVLSGQSARDPVLPPTLGSLKLANKLTGRDAQGMIDRLHDKSVTPVNSVVGHYAAAAGEATLYVSVYRMDAEAASTFKKMADRIRTRNQVFTHYQERSFWGQTVARCYGLGQAHYFFSRNNHLYWLGADFEVAQAALQSLLGKVSQAKKQQ